MRAGSLFDLILCLEGSKVVATGALRNWADLLWSVAAVPTYAAVMASASPLVFLPEALACCPLLVLFVYLFLDVCMLPIGDDGQRSCLGS